MGIGSLKLSIHLLLHKALPSSLRTSMVLTYSSVSLTFIQPLTKPTLTISKTWFMHVPQSLHMVIPRYNQHNLRQDKGYLEGYKLHMSEFCSASHLSTTSILNNCSLTLNGSPCSPLLTPSLACTLWSCLLAINMCMARSSRLTGLSETVTLCPSLTVNIKIHHGPLTMLLTAVWHFILVLIVVQLFGITEVMMATKSMWQFFFFYLSNHHYVYSASGIVSYCIPPWSIVSDWSVAGSLNTLVEVFSYRLAYFPQYHFLKDFLRKSRDHATDLQSINDLC